MLSRFGAHLLIGLLWLLHFLPLPLLAALGQGLGGLLWRLAPARKRIALRNLALCFPELSEPERVARTMQLFADARIAFAHTAVSVIDAVGNPVEGRQGECHEDTELSMLGMMLGTDVPIIGASCAYRADVFRAFAELPPRILREDVILPIRGLMLGEGRFLSSKLVRYRTHDGNLHSPSQAQTSADMVQRNLRFADDRAAFCAQLSADIAKARADGRNLPVELDEYLRRETD